MTSEEIKELREEVIAEMFGERPKRNVIDLLSCAND